MDVQAEKKLSPDEAGAFAAQWAETHSVTAEQLGDKLGIDSGAVESLLNQSRGRLSMSKWASQRKPMAAPSGKSYGPIAAAGTVCFLIGGLISYSLFPQAVARPSTPSASTYLPGGSPAGSIGLPVAAAGGGAGTITGAPSRPASVPVGLGVPLGNRQIVPIHPADAAGAVERLGMTVGADIEQLTSTGPRRLQPVPLEAASGTPSVVGHTISDPHMVSANAFLRAKGVQIPNDLVIWIRTPPAIFTVEGVKTGNEIAARSLTAEKMLPVLRGLMAYAMEQSPPLPYQPPKDPTQGSMIILKMGTLFRDYPIDWTPASKSHLLTMFAAPVSDNARSLIQPFLDNVRSTGKELFRVMPAAPSRN